MQIAVLGAGVIGMSVAWRLARAGHQVHVFDDRPGDGASFAAAGMLAPASEAWYGETDLLRLGLASRRRWPEFAADLAQDARTDPWLATTGTLLVGATTGDAADLDRLAGLLATHGEHAETLDRTSVRDREPGLSAHVRRVLAVPADLSVHNRRLLAALREAATACGVSWHEEWADVEPGGTAVRGRATGRCLAADRVVVATGARTSGTRPVKGQILRLRSDRPVITHTVRALVAGRPVYAVPRADGEIVLGATAEDIGFDTRVTVEGMHDLLRLGLAVLPGLRDVEVVEHVARLRPSTPDNLPLIGEDGDVLVASGHFRGGVLLAPVTAEAICALVGGTPPPDEVSACDPSRFRATRAGARDHTTC